MRPKEIPGPFLRSVIDGAHRTGNARTRLNNEAKATHEGLKNGTIERSHSFSLTYAKKDVNEAEKNLALAKKLWEQPETVLA